MANRYCNQFQLTQEKRVTSIFAKVSFGATGAPTLSASNSKGVLSVTRNNPGTYTFVFGSGSGVSQQLDSYVKVMGVNVVFNTTAVNIGVTPPVAPILFIAADNTGNNAVASITVVLVDDAFAAADPASGEIGYFEFIFGDSVAP
jgi:hypothetical protein